MKKITILLAMTLTFTNLNAQCDIAEVTKKTSYLEIKDINGNYKSRVAFSGNIDYDYSSCFVAVIEHNSTGTNHIVRLYDGKSNTNFERFDIPGSFKNIKVVGEIIIITNNDNRVRKYNKKGNSI